MSNASIQSPKYGNGKQTVLSKGTSQIETKQRFTGPRHSASGAGNTEKGVKYASKLTRCN